MADTGVIVAAAGQGQRMGSKTNKVFLPLFDLPIINYSLEVFSQLEDIAEIVIVAHPVEVDFIKDKILNLTDFPGNLKVIAGGKERQDSVRAGLSAIDQDLELVAVHDAARPLLSLHMVRSVIASAREFGAACPGIPVKDTLKEKGDDGFYRCTLDRSRIYQVQTPQVFRLKLLQEAYRRAQKEEFVGTDESMLFERYCGPVKITEGEYSNLKITTMEDLHMAEGLMRGRDKKPAIQSRPGQTNVAIRIGNGFDVHRLAADRDLIMGGVKIPFEKGLLGHSDADVLTHAICDALLGAAGKGDIGHHFPDTDEKYRGISSLLLLKEVRSLIAKEGWRIANIDATVIAQRPYIKPYINEMINSLGDTLEIPSSAINIKATTTEGLGFTGRQEGISAMASALLEHA